MTIADTENDQTATGEYTGHNCRTDWVANSRDTGITSHPIPKNRNEVTGGPVPMSHARPRGWSDPSLCRQSSLAPGPLGGQEPGYWGWNQDLGSN